jgi:hypothetical protein
VSALDLDRVTIADALDVMAHGRATSARSRDVRTYAAGRIQVDLRAREVYSYGSHFPLLRYVPPVRAGARPLVVLNGDEWRNGGGPSRTRDHQGFARELASAIADTVVIPFSALTGAGIDIDSVRPVHTRPDTNWQETLTAERLEDVPSWARSSWSSSSGALVDLAPRADGLYAWTVHRHRLGDCLFSAVREEAYTRPARPFEVSRELTRGRGRVDVAWRDSYCGARTSGAHETGPSGACIHCGRALEARVTLRRRALYLSSFDYQEPRPLYFLAEVPRGAGADTVETAIDALAPRAVHAARARSIPVERQGDVFFIRTALTLEQFEQRGIASRARLTQWTRDARARKGETGYVRPLTASERRAMGRYRRAEWRRIFRGAFAQVSAPRDMALDARADRRVRRADEWRHMVARHASELAAAAAAGANVDKAESTACESCGAPVGAACDTAHSARFKCYKREILSARQTAELRAYRNATAAGRTVATGPYTAPAARAEWAKRRARTESELAAARATLRAATFGARPPRGYYTSRYQEASRYSSLTPLQYERRTTAQRVRDARARLETLKQRARVESCGRAAARDAYRAPFKAGPPAAVAWSMAGAAARAKFYPSEYDGAAIAKRRERVRRALSVYGTAHSASEVVRTRAGAVYVRGTVRHVPDLERGRDGGRDHVALELGRDGAYWLAVRNTVPRQGRRRTV